MRIVFIALFVLALGAPAAAQQNQGAPAHRPMPQTATAPDDAGAGLPNDQPLTPEQSINNGVFHLERGDLEAALAAFTDALAVRDDATVHLHLGRTYEAMGQPDQAIAEYEVAIAMSAEGAPLRADAEASIERLRLPENPPEDPPAEPTEPEPNLDTHTVDFPDETIESNDPRPEVDEATLEDAPLDPLVLALGAGATASLLGAAVFGIMALDADHEFDQGVEAVANATEDMARETAHADALDAADRADSFALISDVLLGVAIASGTATAIVLLTSDDEEAPVVRPAASPSALGVHVSGAF